MIRRLFRRRPPAPVYTLEFLNPYGDAILGPLTLETLFILGRFGGNDQIIDMQSITPSGWRIIVRKEMPHENELAVIVV